MTQKEKHNIYVKMFNNCDKIAKRILQQAEAKGHKIYNDRVDVFVGEEETEKYFVDFEAKNRLGTYYRFRGNYTLGDLEALTVIAHEDKRAWRKVFAKNMDGSTLEIELCFDINNEYEMNTVKEVVMNKLKVMWENIKVFEIDGENYLNK